MSLFSAKIALSTAYNAVFTMYVPDELKVNKAVDVHLPSNEVYFGRFGEASVGDHLYTGDEVATMEQNKVDELQAYQQYAEMMAEESWLHAV